MIVASLFGCFRFAARAEAAEEEGTARHAKSTGVFSRDIGQIVKRDHKILDASAGCTADVIVWVTGVVKTVGGVGDGDL